MPLEVGLGLLEPYLQRRKQEKFYRQCIQQAVEVFKFLSSAGAEGQTPIKHFSPGDILSLSDQEQLPSGTVFRETVLGIEKRRISYGWHYLGGFDPTETEALIIAELSLVLYQPTLRISPGALIPKRIFLKTYYQDHLGKIEYQVGAGCFNDFWHENNQHTKEKEGNIHPDRVAFLKGLKNSRNTLGADIIIAGTRDSQRMSALVGQSSRLMPQTLGASL